MSNTSKSGLIASASAVYFDNSVNAITPAMIRQLNQNWITSSVVLQEFNTYTSSADSTFAGTASYAEVAVTASIAMTASFLSGSIESASFAATASYLSGSAQTASFALTASYISGSVESASFALTASYLSGSVETASFALTASYLSGSVDTASYSFTASYLNATASYAYTASYLSGSVDTASFAFTASYLSGSVDSASLAQTASYLNSTASYAYTASYLSGSVDTASYAFTSSYVTGSIDSLTLKGNLTVLGTASVAFLYTTIESSSVIYSSGSNQFGDNTDDVQQLYGTVTVSGSQQITGSLTAPEITGSLFGTASWADNSTTASYALTASFLSGSIETASFAFTASYLSGSVDTASFAFTASYLSGSVDTASYAFTASYLNETASYAYTASYISGSVETASFAFTASYLSGSVDTASFAHTASYLSGSVDTASFAFTASYLSGSVDTASYAFTASYLNDTASYAYTASYLSGSVETASFAFTASYLSGSVDTASFAFTASYFSGSVETASFAFTASYVSGSIESASYAETASFAYTASYLSGSIESASYAATASYALTASYLSGSVDFKSGSFATTGSNRFRGEQVFTDFSSSKDLKLSGSAPEVGGNGIPEIQFFSGSAFGRISARNRGASNMDISILDNATVVAKFSGLTSSIDAERFEFSNTKVKGSSFEGTFTGSFSGSIETASFAFTASYLSGSIESASYAATASFAYTASYLSGSIESASYAATASLAATASYVSGAVNLNSSNFFYGRQFFAPQNESSSVGGIVLTGSEGYDIPSIYFISSSEPGLIKKDARIDALTPNEGGDLAIQLVSNGQRLVTFHRETSSIITYVLDLTGVTNVSGSNFLGTFTGSFSGSIESASYSDSASVAISSSFSLTASYFSGSVETASFAFTASYISGSVETASYALTASYLSGSTDTASYALTASQAETASFAFTSSYLSGSVDTASFAFTASYLSGSVDTASFAITASFLSGSVESASYAATASFALTASYLSGSADVFPFTGSARISGSLYINSYESAIDDNIVGPNAIIVAGRGLILDNSRIGGVAFGQFNRTGSVFSNASSSFVVGYGTGDGNGRQNIIDYREGMGTTLILGNSGTQVILDGYTRITRRNAQTGQSLSGSFIIDPGIETIFDGPILFRERLSITSSVDITGSLQTNVFTASVAQIEKLNISSITSSFSGSFVGSVVATGSITGSLTGTWNGTGSAAFIHTGSTNAVQTLTGSLNMLGNLTVLGTASFQSVTASSILVDQNTITVYANSTASLPKAGYLAVDTASINDSGSLLYDVTEQRWESDRNFYAPAVSASTAVYIGNGTPNETFRLIVSSSSLLFEKYNGTTWDVMGEMK